MNFSLTISLSPFSVAYMHRANGSGVIHGSMNNLSVVISTRKRTLPSCQQPIAPHAPWPHHARMETGLILCGSCAGNCAAVSSWGQRLCHIQKPACHGAPHHSPAYILFVPSSWASVVWWWRAWRKGTLQAWPLDSHLFPGLWPRDSLHQPQPATKRGSLVKTESSTDVWHQHKYLGGSLTVSQG